MSVRACVQIVRRIVGSVDETLLLAIVAARLLAGATHAAPPERTTVQVRSVTAVSESGFAMASTAPMAPMAFATAGDCSGSHTIHLERSWAGTSRVIVRVRCEGAVRAGRAAPAVVVVTTETRTAG